MGSRHTPHLPAPIPRARRIAPDGWVNLHRKKADAALYGHRQLISKCKKQRHPKNSDPGEPQEISGCETGFRSRTGPADTTPKTIKKDRNPPSRPSGIIAAKMMNLQGLCMSRMPRMPNRNIMKQQTACDMNITPTNRWKLSAKTLVSFAVIEVWANAMSRDCSPGPASPIRTGITVVTPERKNSPTISFAR